MADAVSKRGVSIFMAADAPENSHDTELSEEQLVPLLMVSELMSLGLKTKVLVPDAHGFSLKHLWAKPNFPLPRHNHTPHDCMYYVISGSALMGNRTLRAGDSFLVPGGAPYQYTAGPDGIEVLEIRHGGTTVDMNVLENAESYRDRATGVLDANREEWAKAEIAPTFAANAS